MRSRGGIAEDLYLRLAPSNDHFGEGSEARLPGAARRDPDSGAAGTGSAPTLSARSPRPLLRSRFVPDSEPTPAVQIRDWRIAEEFAAAHMKTTLKLTNVRLTAGGTDSGIDVRSIEAIAQVKWYASPVGIAEVQRLRGTVPQHQWALFYASPRGYTEQAKLAATKGNVALFVLLSSTRLAAAANHVAESYERMRLGIPQKQDDENGLDFGAKMALSRRHWELNAAIRAFTDRTDKLWRSEEEMWRTFQGCGASAPLDEELAQPMWSSEDTPDQHHAALRALDDATSWSRHFDGGIETPLTARIDYQERILPEMPSLVDAVLGTSLVPLDRMNAWCDYWTDREFNGTFAPPARWLSSRVWREARERAIATGPRRDQLESHARNMAVRVVI